MTVGELIDALQGTDLDRLVVVSSDGEGNSKSPLASIGTAAYLAETTWRGETGLEPADLDDEVRAQGYSEEDVLDDPGAVAALVLWPVA